MNSNLKSLVKVCDLLGVNYKVHHQTNNLIELRLENANFFFANWTSPLNSQSVVQICSDKDYLYTLLKDLIRMPLTKSFLDPNCDEKFKNYLFYKSSAEILDNIEGTFKYPIIIKRNRGYWGVNVFKVSDKASLHNAIITIFDRNSSTYDYVMLAQEYIDIKNEYRAIFLDGEAVFVYEKNIDNANYIGNLSPLHWEGGKAVLVKDNDTINKISEFCLPLYERINLVFGGIDIAEDINGDLWLIEANASPGLEHFITDEGDREVLFLYEKIVKLLASSSYCVKGHCYDT